MKEKLEAIESTFEHKIESLANVFTTAFGTQSGKIANVLEPLLLIKNSLIEEVKKSEIKSEEASKIISEKQNDIESKLQSVFDICTNLKTQKIQEAEEKRDQLREMTKQVNSLSELAQHSQVWNFFEKKDFLAFLTKIG